MKLKLEVMLGEVLKQRDNMTQKQLNDLIEDKYGKDSRLRAAAISEIVNNQRKTINREHLEIIAGALEITDISKLIRFKESDS